MKKFITLGLMVLIASVMFGQALHTIDFEFEGTAADWTWEYCCNDDNPPLEFVDNPSFTEPNVSDKVIKFICRTNGDAWSFFFTRSDGEFTLDADNCIIKVMVYKTITSDVGFKLQTEGADVTVVQANTLVNEWEEMTFDFTANIGETYDEFGIMPSLINRTEDVICYLDNIQVPDGVLAAVDTDGDGTTDDADPDDDNDGNPDETDPNPLVATTAPDVLTVTEGTTETVNVLANDDFLPGVNTSLVDLGTGTATGTISLDGTTGELIYTPAAGEEGTDVTVIYTVCNTDATPNVCKDETVTITVEVASSLADVKSNVLLLYPNPVTDLVTIPSAQNGELVEVRDVTGALVISVMVNNGVLSLGDLVNGMYFVTVNEATVKIIKR